MSEPLVENFGLLRRAIRRFKGAARAALSQELPDGRLNSIRAALSAEDEAQT